MKQSGRYAVIFIAAMALWNTIIIKPLKILSVFFHELGHSLMAVIFGNGIAGFRIYFNESGYARTLPKDWFSAFIIANGGYTGSVLFALLILKLKKRRQGNTYLEHVPSCCLHVDRIRRFFFTVIYAAIFAGFVIIIYMLRNDRINDWATDIIGVVCAVYAVYDTFVDTILLEINRKIG